MFNSYRLMPLARFIPAPERSMALRERLLARQLLSQDETVFHIIASLMTELNQKCLMSAG